MKREIIVSSVIAAAMFALYASCVSCIPQSAKEAIADKTYTAEHLACVDKYDTRAEIDACREGVRIRWGIATTVTDGGAHD